MPVGTNSQRSTVAPDGMGGFDVQGTHKYAFAGTYDLTITIKDDQNRASGNQGSVASTTVMTRIMVASAALFAVGELNTVKDGELFNGEVCNFVISDPSTTANDFSASIDWGDGATSSGAGLVIELVMCPQTS